MIAVSVLAIGFVAVKAETKYSFQEQVPGNATDGSLIITHLTDCNLTITFSDEPNLLYRMDIEYYEPVSIWFAYPRHTISADSEEASVHIYPTRRVRSLNITVGPVVSFLDIFACWNINSTIVYDGAVDLNQYLLYFDSGPLNVIVTEDIRNRVGGYIDTHDVRLGITVPTGFSGAVLFSSVSVTTERTGWEYSLDLSYSVHAYGTYDGFYNNSTESTSGDRLIGDFVFTIYCYELYLNLVS